MTNAPDHRTRDSQQETETAEQPVAKTKHLSSTTHGVIAADIGETRFAEGGRRYGVVFRRDVGDLCLEGRFSMSLGQDELMDLIAAASTAYHEIDAIRLEQRQQCKCPKTPYEQLANQDGWEPDHDEVFAEQIER